MIYLETFNSLTMSSIFKRTQRSRSKSTNSSKQGSVESVERSSSDDGRLLVASNTLDDNNDPRIRNFLYKLREAYTWKERYSSMSEELHDLVKELLRHSTNVQSQLTFEGSFDDADRLAKDTDEIKNFWGKDLLRKFNIRTFNREIMDFQPFIVTAAQYFEPEEMYQNDEQLKKIFSFTVAEASTGNAIFKYYLLYSRYDRDCYILDLMTSKGHHQIRPYGVICPSYWSVRKDVLCDFSRRTGGALGNTFMANLPTGV